jgi:VanZ family protein
MARLIDSWNESFTMLFMPSRMIQDRVPPMLRRWAFWLCVLAVLVLALMPASAHLPSTGWDKANHALAFAVMAVLGRWAYPQRTAAVLLSLLAYGGLIEALQALTPDRSSELGDWLADCVGLSLAWLAMRLPALWAA